jgi:hypothetical protein
VTITSAVALYGAVLSTLVLIRDLWNRRARSRVTTGYSHVGKVGEQGSGFVLVARISNHGRESVFLDRCGIEVPGLGTMTGGYREGFSKLPAELKAGQSADFGFDAESVYSWAGQRRDTRIRAVYWDQLGRKYKSQPLFRAR